jgi:hypothetical protein
MNTLVRTFFSNFSELTIGGFGSGTINYPFDEAPLSFLEYAEDELVENKPSKLANALSHAERALASQLDYFFLSYGLTEYARTNDWGNGKKIALLGDLGVVHNRILHKVNAARNDLEHRYKLPSYQTAVNAVDIVGIFLAATDMFLYPAREDAEFLTHKNSKEKGLIERLIGDKDNRIIIALKRQDSSIQIDGAVLGIAINDKISVTESPKDFFFLFTLLLNYHRLDLPKPEIFFNKLKYLKS